MSLAPGKENYDNFKGIKNRVLDKISSKKSKKILVKDLRKPGAKTDSEMRTHKANKEYEDAHREMMAKRWGNYKK